MSQSLTEKRLMKEKQKIDQSNNTQFLAFPSYKNIYEWHFLLYNLKDSPYEGGQYHGKILIPAQYPLKPPSIIFITPQGRFKCGDKICLSFTNYHPETWSTSWTIQGMLIGLISFMNTDEQTLGGIQTTVQQKIQYANQSNQFNNNNPIYLDEFKNHLIQLNLLFQNQQKPQMIINHTQSVSEQISENPILQNNPHNYPVLVDQQQVQNNANARNQQKRIIIYVLLCLFIIVIVVFLNQI